MIRTLLGENPSEQERDSAQPGRVRDNFLKKGGLVLIIIKIGILIEMLVVILRIVAPPSAVMGICE